MMMMMSGRKCVTNGQSISAQHCNQLKHCCERNKMAATRSVPLLASLSVGLLTVLMIQQQSQHVASYPQLPGQPELPGGTGSDQTNDAGSAAGGAGGDVGDAGGAINSLLGGGDSEYRPNRGDAGIPIGKNLGYFSGGMCVFFRISDLVLGFRRFSVLKSFLPMVVLGGNMSGNALDGEYEMNLAYGLLNDASDEACLQEDVRHFQFNYFASGTK